MSYQALSPRVETPFARLGGGYLSAYDGSRRL